MSSETIVIETRDKELLSQHARMSSDAIEVLDRPAKRLVVESRVRGLLTPGTRMSSDAIEGLDKVVRRLVERAAARCQANKRKTIYKEDF